jgi:hypothetical protein
VSIDLSGYNDVAARMIEFREKYPEGCLQPIDPAKPFEVVTVGEKVFIAYTAAAYRTADDPRPGIGVAWESFPGRTNYTRDSELMNAETSAWGRAILAVGAADAKKGIASAEEVRNRQSDREQWDEAKPTRPTPTEEVDKATAAILRASNEAQLTAITGIIQQRLNEGVFAEDNARELLDVVDQRRARLTRIASEQDAAAEKPTEAAE